MQMANRPEQYTAHAAEELSLFYRETLTSAFGGAGWKKKKNGAGKCLLFKTTLEWTTDQKHILLYRDAEGNPSLDFMVDILQQKRGEGEQNQTSNQPASNRVM